MQFDRFAGDYARILDSTVAVSGEDSAYFAEYKARYLRRLFTPSFSGKVLEYGCGIGLLSGFLKKCLPKIQLDGFDVSHDSIGKVKGTLRKQGVFTFDSARLARDYHLIVIANVMHHIPPEQRQQVVQDLAGRLNSRGSLAIFEHNPANPVTRRVVERCPFDDDAVLLAPNEIKAYLKKANLDVARCDYIVFLPHVLAWFRRLEPWLAWLPLGAQYAMVARKHD